jgi:hypothetical protein
VSKLVGEVVTDPTGPYGEALVLDLGPPDEQQFAVREINLRTLEQERADESWRPDGAPVSARGTSALPWLLEER